jgi:hypothetical protein
LVERLMGSERARELREREWKLPGGSRFKSARWAGCKYQVPRNGALSACAAFCKWVLVAENASGESAGRKAHAAESTRDSAER